MNKEQIEEMAVIGCVRNPQAHSAEECAKCDFKNGQCNSYRHAKALYSAGYRKVPNGAVILTPEERDEELKACNEKQAELGNEIYALKTNYDCLSEHCTDLENKNVAAENMIDSQAKEIERLKADNEALQRWNDAYTEENEKLKKMNDIAHVLLGQAIRHIDVDEQLDRYMQASKEGAQEFAKKLKERLMQDRVTNDNVVIVTGVLIDELLKEYEK